MCQNYIHFTLNQNYFKYKSHFYNQQDGLAMGSPLSGLLADIYMHHLETTKIMADTNPFKNKILYWFRYVDDVLCLFNNDTNNIQDLIEYLNSISENIKFTNEINNKSINFLDLSISNENCIHTFQIYRKPTQSDLIIPKNSNHPWHQKLASFRFMINRLLKVPLSHTNFNREKSVIIQLALTNGYSKTMIENMIRNINKKLKNHSKKENFQTEVKNEYICLTYNSTINKSIRKTFEKRNYKIGFRTKNNCFDLINKFTKNQRKTANDYEQTGIYQINCSTCNSKYIGQTGRSFKKRFNEHIQALKSNNLTTQKSTFAQHLLETNHEYKNMKENMKILQYGQKGEKLNIKEDFHIYKMFKEDPSNILNIRQTNKTNPIFEKIIKKKQTTQ